MSLWPFLALFYLWLSGAQTARGEYGWAAFDMLFGVFCLAVALSNERSKSR